MCSLQNQALAFFRMAASSLKPRIRQAAGLLGLLLGRGNKEDKISQTFVARLLSQPGRHSEPSSSRLAASAADMRGRPDKDVVLKHLLVDLPGPTNKLQSADGLSLETR
ncbi:hypothetical protein WJX72_000128 [[Myrmecia] bisecta]|uniref:Uncharacterized protein n=1 Tax=[Myrmecia] bisecta TaxID=41462 RepID=A0AAW1P3J3_9CHLO